MEYTEEEHKHVIFNKAVDYSESESPKTLDRKFQSETLLRPSLNESSSILKHKSVVIKISNWDNKNSLINSNDSIGTEATERTNSLDAIKHEYLNFHKDFRNRTNKERKKKSISDTDIKQNEPPQSCDNEKSVEPTYNVISYLQSYIESKFAKQTNRKQETNCNLNSNEAPVCDKPETSKTSESKTDYKTQVKNTVEKVKLLLRVWMGLEIPKDNGSPVDCREVVQDDVNIANPDIQNFMQNFNSIWNSTNRHSIDESFIPLKEYFKGSATVKQVTEILQANQAVLPASFNTTGQKEISLEDSLYRKKSKSEQQTNLFDRGLTESIYEKKHEEQEVIKNNFDLPNSLTEIINPNVKKINKKVYKKSDVVSAKLPNIVFNFNDDIKKKPYKEIADIIENSSCIKRPTEINTISIDDKLIKNYVVYKNNDIKFKTNLKFEVEENSEVEKIHTTSEIEKQKHNDSLSCNIKDKSHQTNKNDKENNSESNTLNTINAQVSDFSNISGFRSIHEEWGRTNREACDKNSLKAINKFLNGTSNLKTLNVVLSRNNINNENINLNNDKNSTESSCKLENQNSTKDSCSNKHMQLCQNNSSLHKGNTIRKDLMRSYIRQRAQLQEYTQPFQPSHIQHKDKQITQFNRKQYVSEHDESNSNINRNIPDIGKSQTKLTLCKMKYIQPMEDLITDDFHKRLEKQFHKKS